MADTKVKNHEETSNKVSPMAAAVAGVVVGAGIAVAGAIALKDENNREKVKDALNSAKDKAADYVQSVQQAAQDKKAELENIVTEAKASIDEEGK